eukprot:4281127-Pyramimonas_sp.AAC.1
MDGPTDLALKQPAEVFRTLLFSCKRLQTLRSMPGFACQTVVRLGFFSAESDIGIVSKSQSRRAAQLTLPRRLLSPPRMLRPR